MKGDDFKSITTYIILGLFAVLAVTHASQFATAIGAVGNLITGESKILAGG